MRFPAPRGWAFVALALCSCAGPGDDLSLKEGFGFAGEAVGGACKVSDDCADSKAARDFRLVRCGSREIYCRKNVCHAMCAKYCDAFRTDLNPCEDGQLCIPPQDPRSPTHCTAQPIPCDAPDDCPLFRPLDDAGVQSQWECVDGVCRYPGYEYGAQ